MSKIGLILEGGAFRGVYTAGVMDYLLEKNVTFPYVVGVSAGAGNALNFLSKQVGRTKKVITHEDREGYYGLGQLFENKKILNLDRLVREFALVDFPFDFETFYANPTVMETVATCCETGKAVYFGDFRNNSQEYLFKTNMASCSVPFICDPIEIDDLHYLDGSLADSVPFERALEMGCDKVVIVMTKPEGGQATDYGKAKSLINLAYKNYPNLCETLMNRKNEYERQIELMNRLEREGIAYVIRPESKTVGRFESDYEKLCECYDVAYHRMESLYADLMKFMEQ